jgi:hypothetical protein
MQKDHETKKLHWDQNDRRPNNSKVPTRIKVLEFVTLWSCRNIVKKY